MLERRIGIEEEMDYFNCNWWGIFLPLILIHFFMSLFEFIAEAFPKLLGTIKLDFSKTMTSECIGGERVVFAQVKSSKLSMF